MGLIINEIYELQDFDGEKLAKYIRCMVQAVLPLDDALALQLIDQALQIAREGQQVGVFLLPLCERRVVLARSPPFSSDPLPLYSLCFTPQ